MSRALMVYSVDLHRLRGVAGSRDQSLQRSLTAGSPASRLVRGDAIADAADAVAALEDLCRLLGRQLPNETVAPLAGETMEAVDAALEQAGIDSGLRLMGLAYRGAPMSLSFAKDFPFVGFVEANVLGPSSPLLARATSVDIYADDILREMEDWISIAGANKQGLVGFYY